MEHRPHSSLPRKASAWGLGAAAGRAVATLFAAVALALSASAHAAPASVFLEDLTSPELRRAMDEGSTTVIVPVGGTEQNGPHMALGKHNARVKVLAGRIATALGHAVVAPVLPYVPESASHKPFAGTIDAPREAFVALLGAAAEGFKDQGFREVVFIGDSGDYQGLLQTLAERLNRAWAGSPARAVHVGAYYREAQAAYRRALQARGLSEAQIGVHAGVADTALLMATAPSLVRVDQLGAAQRGSPANGVTGDPRAATAALGEIGVEVIVTRSVAAIRQAAALPR